MATKVREQWIRERQGRKLPGWLHVTTLCEGTYPGTAILSSSKSPDSLHFDGIQAVVDEQTSCCRRLTKEAPETVRCVHEICQDVSMNKEFGCLTRFHGYEDDLVEIRRNDTVCTACTRI